MSAPPPLAGVKILAVEQFGAGPYASLHLSDMGAEVIKIEAPPGGDFARQNGPHRLAPNESLFFQCFNLGKKSVALDIRHPKGKEIFLRLVASADAVLNNLRGDQPDKLGLTYAALGKLRPSLVCAHISGYGRTGPRAAWPAFDYLAQAEAGFMAMTGEPDGPPQRMGLSIIDFLTGITTAFGLTAALFAAARTGAGRDVDVTLYDVALHQLTYPAIWYLNAGDAVQRKPRSGHPTVVPCEMFPTADGNIFIMAMTERFWRELCDCLGAPELAADPRFADPDARLVHRDTLVAAMDAALHAKSTADWMATFAGRVPAAPVLSLASALDNDFAQARGAVQSVPHPLRQGLRVLTNPVRLDGLPTPSLPAPLLGADTDAVLDGVGVGEAERRKLRDERVIA